MEAGWRKYGKDKDIVTYAKFKTCIKKSSVSSLLGERGRGIRFWNCVKKSEKKHLSGELKPDHPVWCRSRHGKMMEGVQKESWKSDRIIKLYWEVERLRWLTRLSERSVTSSSALWVCASFLLPSDDATGKGNQYSSARINSSLSPKLLALAEHCRGCLNPAVRKSGESIWRKHVNERSCATLFLIENVKVSPWKTTDGSEMNDSEDSTGWDLKLGSAFCFNV